MRIFEELHNARRSSAVLLACLVAASAWSYECQCKCMDAKARCAGATDCEQTCGNDHCILTFNGNPENQQKLDEYLKTLNFTPSANIIASNLLHEVEPSKWDKTFIARHVPALIAAAGYERSPDKVKGITSFLQKYAENIIPAFKGEAPEVIREGYSSFERDGYYTEISLGCLEIQSGGFIAAVKTVHSIATDGCRPSRKGF